MDGPTLRKAASCAPEPCRWCPWRTENHGKKHPGGWYTAENRRRLWRGLRTGDGQTCHPTDPDNPIPEGWLPGFKPPPAGSTPLECAGATVLQQREFERVQRLAATLRERGDKANAVTIYRRRHPAGLTRNGVLRLFQRIAFGGVPLIGGARMGRPDLNAPVSHEALTAWGASPEDPETAATTRTTPRTRSTTSRTTGVTGDYA